MSSSIYQSGEDFRKALEVRLKTYAKAEEMDLQRVRTQVAFERFLARIFSGTSDRWLLKGGYGLELRMAAARATKDVDLTVRIRMSDVRTLSSSNFLREMLEADVKPPLDDYFEFFIGSSVVLDGPRYGGLRFPIDTRIANRRFVLFSVDIGVGDTNLEPFEQLSGRDWLGFAGIPAGQFLAINLEQQFAEKVHAYTLARQTPNTRAKDLVDLALLVHSGSLNFDVLRKTLIRVFKVRGTHSLPSDLEPPPSGWQAIYTPLARECGLDQSISEAYEDLSKVYQQVVQPGTIDG